MDHIEQNVQYVMERYTPRVPLHRYSINYVPVVNKMNSEPDIRKMLLYNPRYGLYIPMVITNM